MSVENIGYALTVALTIGVVFSLGFGILADKFDKKTLYADRHRRLYRRVCGHSAGE
ncbi:Putative transport protein [Enterobacter hormaechei]|nr:Putative transport protein [Enterobacter hormaechei]